MKRTAALICNGLSADGYNPPEDAFVVTINGGFLKRRADAAFTVDCPSEYRDAWIQWPGVKVQAAHNAMYPDKKNQLFDCLEDVKQYHSSTPAAIRWILEQGYKRCVVAGMDALYGQGKPGSAYSAEGHAQFLAILAPKFEEGLYVWHDGKEVRVDDKFLSRLGRFCEAVKKTIPESKRDDVSMCKIEPTVPISLKCGIPQTMIEFDPSPRCTRKCSFCDPGIPAGRRKQKHGLSLRAHHGVIDQLVACGYNNPERWLCYCGHGEPLLNKHLFKMMRYAREKLPACRMVVYTNGDALTVEHCCTWEALDVDVVIWDCYDQANADKVPSIIAASSLDPKRVRVNDYREGMKHPSSRCSSVSKADLSTWQGKPCQMPHGKLFFTDDGKDGKWLLCCECYDRQQSWPGTMSPQDVNSDQKFRAIVKALEGGHRTCCDACSKCDRDGGHPEGFGHVPALVGSKLWPCVPAIPKTPGKRLVVLPVNDKWARHGEVVLNAIDRAACMDGHSLVLWNDDRVPHCPDFLKGKTREVIEYPRALGWCGINVGISDAFRRAIDNGFDYVIKLDTDTAILSKGFDSILCGECGVESQLGTYMDASITGMMPMEAAKHGGLFSENFAKLRWSRNFSARGLRRWDHIQGGLYVIGVEALKRVQRVIGLDSAEQAALPEPMRVGEDVYIDTKCKISRVPQKDSQRLRIWFREPRFEKDLAPVDIGCIRHQRDNCGVVAVHPVKDIHMLKALANEI